MRRLELEVQNPLPMRSRKIEDLLFPVIKVSLADGPCIRLNAVSHFAEFLATLEIDCKFLTARALASLVVLERLKKLLMLFFFSGDMTFDLSVTYVSHKGFGRYLLLESHISFEL